MHTRLLAGAVALLFISPVVNAQVFKCATPSGQIVYSDAPCPIGTAGQHMERRRTADEIRHERLQAAQAETRKQQLRQAEERAQWEAQRQNGQVLRTSPPASDWQRRKQQQNEATAAGSITRNGGGWDRAAEAEREKRRRAQELRTDPAPTSITHCDSGFCYDNLGGVYHRNGPDFMTGPNGQSCTSAGNVLNCN